jgi:Acetyltransferase (GNAT) domain
MIIIQRKFGGILPYRLIYWPTEMVLRELAENLPLTHYARVESANVDLERGRCIVGHHVGLTLLVDLQRPLADIYKGLIDNARIRIHKAEKLGARLTLRRYSGGLDEDGLVPQFVELYNDVLRGKPSQAALISVARGYNLFPSADLLMAYLDGRLICGHLNLIDRETSIARLLHSANKRFDDPATARLAGIVNVYLHWHELERYREEGLASYDFGTIGQVEDGVGVNRFKMQFGGNIVREHHYLLAGMPGAWRTVFNLMPLIRGRMQRSKRVQLAGDRWRNMPLEQIREEIEASIADYQRKQQISLGGKKRTLPSGSKPNADIAQTGFKDKHGKASHHI